MDFKTPTPKKVIIRQLSGGSYKTGGKSGLSIIDKPLNTQEELAKVVTVVSIIAITALTGNHNKNFI